jgi:hypothetical protein
MNWKFWTWAKERRANRKQIETLKATVARQRRLLKMAHHSIHSAWPAHSLPARGLRDDITTELNREA